MIAKKEMIIKLLKVLFPKVKIYLFGSYARGTQTSTSDIDLALDVGKRLTTLELEQAKNVIQALNIPQTIDLVDLNRVPAEMKKIILAEGILWNG